VFVRGSAAANKLITKREQRRRANRLNPHHRHGANPPLPSDGVRYRRGVERGPSGWTRSNGDSHDKFALRAGAGGLAANGLPSGCSVHAVADFAQRGERRFNFVDPTTAGGSSPRLSKPGCILASPSYPANLTRIDQDHIYHWTRDAAIAAVEIATNPSSPLPASASSSATTSPSRGSARTAPPPPVISTEPRTRSTGPSGIGATRRTGRRSKTSRWSPRSPSRRGLQATAKTIAQENLGRIVQDWDSNGNFFNAWKEVKGASFFARAVQLRCLQEVQSTKALGVEAPPGLAIAVTNLTNALSAHWDPTNGWYVSVQNATLPADSLLSDLSGYDPNADIIMACIYGAVPCTDPQPLATATKVRALFDVGGSCAYPINTADHNLSTGPVGPLIGRYPADVYDGDVGMDRSQPTRGHPWAICTANFAEL
jgi:glucoamylase